MPSLLTLAHICDHVYKDSGSTAPGGARRIEVPNGQRFNQTGSSFFGAAYVVGDCGIVAFRGSQESEDWLDADVEIARGRLPVSQLGDAYAFFSAAEASLRASGSTKFIITGHSLGGGLAERVAVSVSRIPVTGVTFNAPGLLGFSQAGDHASLNLPERNHNILHVRSSADMFSLIGQHTGRIITLSDAGLHALGPLIERLANTATGMMRV